MAPSRRWPRARGPRWLASRMRFVGGRMARESHASKSRKGCRVAARPDSPCNSRGDMDHLKTKIRHVPDFPKAGILFYDITTLLQDAEGFRLAIDALSLPFPRDEIDLVVGIESRGFIF